MSVGWLKKQTERPES